MTHGAIGSEQTHMSIFGFVTSNAVKRLFFALKSCARKRDSVHLLQPLFDLRRLDACAFRRFFHFPQADSRKRDMIHIRCPRASAAVFEVARGAALNVRMKRCWLALKERSIVGVADDAFCCFNAFDRRVAGRAIILQRCVGLRQIAGSNHMLPKRGRENSMHRFFSMMRGQRKENQHQQSENKRRKQKCPR